MPGDAEVQNPSSIMRDHEEAVEHPKRQSRYREEVRRGDNFTVIAQKSCPSRSWLRAPGSFPHPTQHSALGDVESEHLQFTMNALRSPGRVLGRHSEDQFTNVLSALSSRFQCSEVVLASGAGKARFVGQAMAI